MIKEFDSNFYNKYPRVYTTAESYGFNINDIDYFINTIHEKLHLNTHFKSKEMLQVYLKALIVRLDMRKDEFCKYVFELSKKQTKHNELDFRDKVGAYQSYILWALIEDINDKRIK